VDALTALALSLYGTPAVSLADLERFPGEVYARKMWRSVPAAQADLCRQTHDRLAYRWLASPWNAENERTLARLERDRRFWELLAGAGNEGRVDEFRLGCLTTLRDLLGEYDYRRGAHPPLITAAMLPPEMPEPVQTRGGNQ
jgi:hypothetical protein